MTGRLDLAIAEAEQRVTKDRILKEKYVQEQESLSEQGPALWGRFREALRVECRNRPKHLNFAVTPNTEASIHTSRGVVGRKTILLRYLPKSKAISYVSDGRSGTYPMRLNDLNLAVICNEEGMAFGTLGEAAEELLSLLFE